MKKIICDICSICYNEELLLSSWIESWLAVPFVDKINLVDGGSKDKTFEIAKSYNRVNIIKVPWKGDFARQRNIAIKMCKQDWIFQPDIDEIPCGRLDTTFYEDNFNEIIIPYIKFYDWNTLWFFKNNIPTYKNNVVHYAINKSTTTIFKKTHLKGYSKSLHEMPLYGEQRKQTIGSQLKKQHVSLDELKKDFFIGHYDQAKHFEQAKQNDTSVYYEMGLKRTRYRLISDAVYEGKIYNKKWALEALLRDLEGDISMIEELGKAQLNSFLKEHFILEKFNAINLNNNILQAHMRMDLK